MKTLQIRVSADNYCNQVSKKGFSAIKNVTFIKDPETITDVFCGPGFQDSVETALAACCVSGVRTNRIHPSNINFGCGSKLNEWINRGLKDIAEEEKSLCLAIRRVIEDHEKDNIEEAIYNAFKKISLNGHGIIFIRSPWVEIITNIFDSDKFLNFKSGDGIILEQDDDVNITILEILKVT